MRAVIRRLWKEERGASVVVGAMLMLLIMVMVYGTIQAYHVPIWNKNVQYEHLNVVRDDMITFKSDVEDVALSREPKSSDFRMGVRYPDRMFLANPGPGVAGALTSDNVAVSIEYTIDVLGDPTITTSYDSNRIIYEVQGTIDSPKLVYEHGVIIRDYGDNSATTDEQSLIVGDEIYIPVLTGNLTASSSMETESIEIKPLSQSYNRTKIKSVTITIDTAYPEVWEELLAGTSTADTTVQVDLGQSEIVITSTAIEQISFPAGNVTADALYAGLVTFSTESEPVTYTSIDISQDYPCILDIDIAEGASAQTQSTITATVKNVAAPFDIHADFTMLTNDPETYDVFPDYSSPDSISATSWELPNENTVQWTNITHPTYAAFEPVVVSFWVINTENNMQFFMSIVFSRRNPVSWF
jgi:Flp pilus assembly pilin Flp